MIKFSPNHLRLEMPIHFKTNFDIFDSPLWGGHIKVPEEIAHQLIDKKNRRVVAVLDNQLEIHAAIMSSAGGFFILINQPLRKKLNLWPGKTLDVTLSKDTSEYGMPMPEALQLILDQNDEGNQFFHQLTPGKQRTLIHMVSSVKNTDSRITKSMAIIDHLIFNGGKLDFSALHELIKQYNQNRRL